jgi:hypothetical protein
MVLQQVKLQPDLKWEEARKFDVGLDLKLFNNKVSIDGLFY